MKLPPVDIIETASFLATLAFVRERGTDGFLASGVARHFEREGLLATLPIRLPIDLPSIGIITLRARGPTPTTARLIDCLRQVAGARRARSGDGGRSSFPARG